jgi:23S rRNA (cytidine1920-2'-O)/16S rRNA (cytidine1409-2'-O)-methyltransferase
MKVVQRKRLDQVLVDRGLAASRSRARDAILRGWVMVSGAPVAKPGYLVDDQAEIAVDDASGLGYVSRGALKLQAALEAFQFPVHGRVGLDVGASTGGFTEILLRQGARKVFAVDIGQAQLAQTLRDDPRVIVLENCDSRKLSAEKIDEPVEIIVADVSFISLTKALPQPLSLAAANSFLVALIKPQFEVGKGGVGKDGIVKDDDLRQKAVDGVRVWLEKQPGWRVRGVVPSPIQGGSGNLEFLIGAECDARV